MNLDFHTFEDKEWDPAARLASLITAGIEDPEHWMAMIDEAVADLLGEQRNRQANGLAQACIDGTPPAYVLGTQKFMGLSFIAEPGVVVPRQVTARVGTAALGLMEELHRQWPGRELRIVDMCSGSGNLACAIASHDPACRVWSCDIMPEASSLAQRNAVRLDLADRVAIRTGDLFQDLAGDGLDGQVDVIVCAPPFISTTRLAKDRTHLLRHEPKAAFDGGPYGLSIHQAVIRQAQTFLRPQGYLVMECGAGQSRHVCLLLDRAQAYDAIEAVGGGDGGPFVVQARLR